MGIKLLLSSDAPSHVLVYSENSSNQCFRAILGAKSRGTETQLVMADSRTVGNVVQPLARSVVEPSTTDVDASNSINHLTASGESSTNTTPTIPQQTDIQNEKDNQENSNVGPYSEETMAQGNSPDLMNSKYAGTKDMDTDSVGTSRPGSASPTKMDAIKPKATIRKGTFRPVSVNRVFLKDPAPPIGPVSNALSSSLSNKASTAFSAPQPAARNVLSASKLKLVKTGASSQTSRPGSAGPAGPTGSKKGEQVWNKNLPTPPPPKKDVTDEELKLEFGIHLASRLVSDNESKEAKWADIDDDDDDWVPEAIQWNDGMKVTMDDAAAAVTAMDAEIVVPPPIYVEPVRPEPVLEVTPPKSPVYAPVIPVLEEVRPKTLVTEKPPPKLAEPPSTHTVRASPWAKIPPPSVGPPAAMNHNLRNNDFPLPPPPRHEFGTELLVQHALSSSAGMKEVSADVYDRSWRDRSVNYGARERELFNSETGQLEPVREVRNGGPRQNRNDTPMQKHSVLQRPPGPAEPSAAFQQSRSSMSFHRPEDHGRRRASSNVSGGSGSAGGRRPSFSTGRFSTDQPPTPDDARFPGPDPRRGSFGYNPFDNEGSRGNYVPSGAYSPQFQHLSPRIAAVSPVMGHTRSTVTQPTRTQPMPPLPSAPVVDPNYEDPVIVQERVMKESRELARKRRQEEEARDEAAKQERLKIKLEALEKQAKLKEEEEAVKRKAIEEKAEAERKAAEEKRLMEEKAAAERRAEEETAAEKAAGERLVLEKERPGQGPFLDRQVREPPMSLVRSRSPGNAATGPHTQGRRQSGQMQSQRSPTKNFTVLNSRELKDQSWKSSGPDRYTSWGSPENNGQAQNSPDGNTWGPIGEKRYSGFNGVGNGTFDNRYSGYSARSNVMHGQQHRDDGRQNGRQSHSGPGFSRGPRPNDSISQEDRSQAVNRWNHTANNLQEDEAAERRRNLEERLAREAEEVATGVKRDSIAHPKIVETYRKVELSDGQGQIDRKLVAVSKTERDEASAKRDAFPVSGTSNLPGPSTVVGTTTQPATANSQLQRNIPTGPAASRSTSRFFPTAAANLLAQHLGSSSKPVDEPTPKINPPGSPPPPMSSEHPVHGDTNSRVVHLPPLPQSQNPSGRISPGSRPNNGYHKTDNPSSPRVFPSCSDFEVIQRRILESIEKVTHMQHSLQHQSARPHMPDSKAPTSKDFSETKPSFEGMRESLSKPSVSLPSSSHGSKGSSEKGENSVGEAQMDGGCILSKPDDEEFFHGLFERDFGSTPTVKIPHHPPIYNGNLSKPPASPLHKPRKFSRSGMYMPQTIDDFDPFDRQEFINGDGKRFIPVHLPGGNQVEVMCKAEVVSRVQEGKQHRKRTPSHRTKPPKTFNTGNGGHMGRGGNVGNGKRVVEMVQ